MTGIKDNFNSLSLSNHIPSVNVVDGIFFSVLGEGIVHVTSSLALNNMLHAPKFPIRLLTYSQITKNKNSFETFSPTYCMFQDLQTGKMIGLVVNKVAFIIKMMVLHCLV